MNSTDFFSNSTGRIAFPTLPCIEILAAIFLLAVIMLPGSLAAQFSDGVVLADAGLHNRSWHITNKDDFKLIAAIGGDVVQQNSTSLDESNTWVVESIPDDGKWWTADKKWFALRLAGTNQFITIENSIGAGGRNVGLDAMDLDNQTKLELQQFEIVPAPAGSGWYRLKSRADTSPKLILELNADGKIYAVDNPITANDRQKFAFNLAFPYNPDVPYSLLGINNQDFMSDKGISSNNSPAVHREDHDHSAMWYFIPAGDGYYFMRNAITGNYLSNNGDTGDAAELFMNTTTSESAKWELIRAGNNVKVKSKNGGQFIGINGQPASDNPLFGVKTNLIGIEWTLFRIDNNEPEALSGNFNQIPTNSNPCIIFGPSFEMAITERAGLPPVSAYFPVVVSALTRYYGGNSDMAYAALQNFNLNDEGHRAELAHAMKYYLLDEVALKAPSQWSPLEAQLLNYFNTKVRDLRVDYAVRLDNAWNDFVASQWPSGNTASQFSVLLNSATDTNFEWPSDYDMTTFQIESMAHLVSANKSFNLSNANLNFKYASAATSLSAPFIGALINHLVMQGITPIAAPIITAALKSTTAGTALTKPSLVAAIYSSGSFANATPGIASSALASAGTVITVAIIAAQILAMEIVEAVQFQKLENKVFQKIAYSQLPVNIHLVMQGNDELAKLKLVNDLEFMLGAPVQYGFVHNFNDNVELEPFGDVSCNNVTVTLDANCTAELLPTTVSGGFILPFCGGDVELSLNQTTFSAADIGQKQVTLTASNSLKTSSCTATVTVQDNTPPTVTCKNTNAVIASYFNGLIIAAIISPSDVYQSGSDNCGTVNLVSVSPFSFGCDKVGPNLVTLTVNDGKGNENTCTAIVTVQDLTPPTAQCQNRIVQLDANGNGALTAAQVDNGSSDLCGISSRTLSKTTFDCSDVDADPVVTLTVKDNSDNVSTCNATITVQDNVPPVAVCQSVPVQLDASGSASLTATQMDAGSNDACGIQSLTLNRYTFDCDDLGTIPMTLTVKDQNNNESTCNASVIVQDNIAPQITCPANIVVSNDPGDCSAVVTFNVTASDNCSFSVAKMAGYNTGQPFPVGVTTNEFQVTDAALNQTSCSFTVTVNKFGDPDLLYAYTVIGMDEVKLKENTLLAGGIGVVNAGKKVKLEGGTTINAPNTFVKAPELDLNQGSSALEFYPGQMDANLLPVFIPNDNPLNTNLDISDNSAPVTLDLGSYGKITIGKNVTATFSGNFTVFIKELKLKEGATLLFSQNTSVHIDKKMDLDKNTTLDRGSHTVWMFVEDDVKFDEGSTVSANIFSQKHLKAEKATAANPTELTGLFIAEKVDAKEFVHWNWNGGQCPFIPNSSNLVVNGSINLMVAQAETAAKLVCVTNLGSKAHKMLIERSADGISFEPLFEMDETDLVKKVSIGHYLDNSPLPGLNFYRAAAEMEDGTTAFSPVRMLEYSLTERLNLFPNPANDHIRVFSENRVGKPSSVFIFNSQGVQVFRQDYDALPGHILTFDLGGFRDGLYLLTLRSEGGRDLTKPFVVARF
jgi:hypothetical protein